MGRAVTDNRRLMEALKAVPDLRAAVEAIERKWLDEGYSTAIEGNISVDLLFAAADRSFGDLRKHVKAIDLDRYPSEYPTCVARRSYGQRPVSLEPFWPESPCGARHHLVTVSFFFPVRSTCYPSRSSVWYD
jgi:hypothetical protein